MSSSKPLSNTISRWQSDLCQRIERIRRAVESNGVSETRAYTTDKPRYHRSEGVTMLHTLYSRSHVFTPIKKRPLTRPQFYLYHPSSLSGASLRFRESEIYTAEPSRRKLSCK